jgi:acylphosphatase
MNQNEPMTAARLKVGGRVQGVGFRYFVYKNARRNGLTGWVRNLEDGSVEAHFEGQKDAIDKVIELCKVGPAGSNVKDVILDWSEPEGSWSEFDFKYS